MLLGCMSFRHKNSLSWVYYKFSCFHFETFFVFDFEKRSIIFASEFSFGIDFENLLIYFLFHQYFYNGFLILYFLYFYIFITIK